MGYLFLGGLVLACLWWSIPWVKGQLRPKRLYGSGLDPISAGILFLLLSMLAGWNRAQKSPAGRKLFGWLFIGYGLYNLVCIGVGFDWARDVLVALTMGFFLGLIPIICGLFLMRPARGECLICHQPVWSPLNTPGGMCCSPDRKST